MIVGRNDTYYTLAEFAGLIGRTEKTIQNWIAEGRLVPHRLFGVPMVSLRYLENVLEGNETQDAADGDLARRMLSHSSKKCNRSEAS